MDLDLGLYCRTGTPPMQHRPPFSVVTCARLVQMTSSHGDSYTVFRACHMMLM